MGCCNILICYDQILEIRGTIQSAYYPNVQAVVRKAFPSTLSLQNLWIICAMACAFPGIEYFHAQLGDDGAMKAFKAAQLFSPHKLKWNEALSLGHGYLRAFPFLDVPTYLSQSADVSAPIDTLKWWKGHHEDLPHWSSVIHHSYTCYNYNLRQRIGVHIEWAWQRNHWRCLPVYIAYIAKEPLETPHVGVPHEYH